MDQSDHQNRSCRAGGPMCDWPGASVLAPQPASVQQHAEPKRGQRLLAAATATAALLVGLNALVQALNVLAAWWSHGHY